MKCPKCDDSLALIEVRGTKVDKCPACRGIWFDEKELEAILEVRPSELRPLGGQENEAFNRVRGNCPRDGSELMRVSSARESDVVVDVCPACQGIWLDGGELQRILS